MLALRDILLEFDKDIEETVKYGMPCFIYRAKIFCYLWIDKESKEPYILFVKGNEMHHLKLEVGTRKRMKILRVNPIEDIPIALINKLLSMAKMLYS